MDNQEFIKLSLELKKCCSQCGEVKSIDDFPYDPRSTDKCYSCCKKCRNIYAREWRNKNPKRAGEIIKRGGLKFNYGVTLEEYNELLLKQDNRCYLCDEILIAEMRQTHLDHDNKTGKIYGVACRRCNVGISYFAHDPERMIQVADRMKKVRK